MTTAETTHPVTVLTGALGAGKTTLLNCALAEGLLGDVAVVVNEFGAVGIDHELVLPSTEDVVVLPGGCLCCTVRSDLADALMRLVRAAPGGTARSFERVIIETSGLAEPGPILQLFAESPALAGRFRLDALVTLVDAVLGADALAGEETARRQVVLADRVLLTRWEQAEPAEVDGLEARIATLNPFAERLRAPRGSARAGWFQPAPPRPLRRLLPERAMRAAHDESVQAFALAWDGLQSLEDVGEWLHDVATRFGPRLLRVKGIVAAREAPRAVAVHAVQHLVAAPEFLSVPAVDSRLVFIVRGLEPGDVRPPWAVRISDG